MPATVIAGAVKEGRADPPSEIRVLICEDDPVMSSALGDFFSSVPGMTVVGIAADGDRGIALAAETTPDAVVLDVRMPGGGGPRVARRLRELLPNVRIVAFSASADRGSVLEMLRAGADEYLVKGSAIDELTEAVRRTGRGLVELPAFELEELLLEVVEQLNVSEQRLEEARRQLAAGAPS